MIARAKQHKQRKKKMANDSWVVDVANQAGSPEKFVDLVVDKLREGTLEEGVKALNEYSRHIHRNTTFWAINSLMSKSRAIEFIDDSIATLTRLRENLVYLTVMAEERPGGDSAPE